MKYLEWNEIKSEILQWMRHTRDIHTSTLTPKLVTTTKTTKNNAKKMMQNSFAKNSTSSWFLACVCVCVGWFFWKEKQIENGGCGRRWWHICSNAGGRGGGVFSFLLYIRTLTRIITVFRVFIRENSHRNGGKRIQSNFDRNEII